MKSLIMLTKKPKSSSKNKSVKYLFQSLIILIIMSFGVISYAIQENTKSDYNIKVAYIFNFLYFVDWPDKEFELLTSPYHICVIGEPLFANALKSLEVKQIKGRPIKTTLLTQDRFIQHCHILYIADSESARLNSLLGSVKDKSVLLISDMQHFSSRGGVIGFVYDKSRL